MFILLFRLVFLFVLIALLIGIFLSPIRFPTFQSHVITTPSAELVNNTSRSVDIYVERE